VLGCPDSNLRREVYVLANCNRRPTIENAVVAYDTSPSNFQVPGVYNIETGVDYHSLGYLSPKTTKSELPQVVGRKEGSKADISLLSGYKLNRFS
jgi:hypothetical protein